MELLHLGCLELLSLVVGVRVVVLVKVFDVVVVLRALQLLDHSPEQRLVVVPDFERLPMFEVAHQLLLVQCADLVLSLHVLCSWRPPALATGPAFLQNLLILLETDQELGESLEDGGAYGLVLEFVELLGLHGLGVVEGADGGLNGVGECDLHLVEHDGPGGLLLLLLDGEGAAVEAEVGVHLLDEFGEDARLVVVGLVDGVGRAVEEGVLLARVPVEVQVHEQPVPVLQVARQLFH